ncbi:MULTISPECIES: OmpW family outer membrane protein [Chryseobacterium]|uniref:Outer membrane protein n=1 Tax=Chryseobacterium balustinum TaxID=246 RepID=A0AAX2INL2_9FLAO|nr:MULTISPECIES: OmpW family outer membrane protein [Chryseobacterium]AZB28960.1 porin family protein [Chryseobacterium balustinum]MDY0930373.1 OmpW family outer membrane protein [Chryseobacterium sp. CFBP8996]SKB61485.1 outer membrane protein [Chryseobacterium balustinum]SQA91297.1 Outer membrane protein W [Chryseobacterium balustinum]
MKKLLLAGAIALCGLSNAQMSKGDWVISGNTGMGFNNVNTTFKAEGQSEDGPKVSTFSVTPSVGYFVIDKLAVGIDLGFTTATTKYDGEKTTTTSFAVMPTATYYFANDSKFVPFLGAGVGYASVKNKASVDFMGVSESEEVTTDGLAWKVKGGVTYMATQSLGINLGVGFDQFSNKESYEGIDLKTKVSTFGVNVGFSYFIKSKPQKSDK